MNLRDIGNISGVFSAISIHTTPLEKLAYPSSASRMGWLLHGMIRKDIHLREIYAARTERAGSNFIATNELPRARRVQKWVRMLCQEERLSILRAHSVNSLECNLFYKDSSRYSHDRYEETPWLFVDSAIERIDRMTGYVLQAVDSAWVCFEASRMSRHYGRIRKHISVVRLVISHLTERRCQSGRHAWEQIGGAV